MTLDEVKGSLRLGADVYDPDDGFTLRLEGDGWHWWDPAEDTRTWPTKPWARLEPYLARLTLNPSEVTSRIIEK